MNLRTLARWLHHAITSSDKRPFIDFSLEELEDLADESSSASEVFRLLGIFDELTYRITSPERRDRLKTRITSHLLRMEGVKLPISSDRNKVLEIRAQLLSRYAQKADTQRKAKEEAAAEKARLEAEAKAQQEAEAKARQEAERKAKEEAAAEKARLEAEAKAQQVSTDEERQDSESPAQQQRIEQELQQALQAEARRIEEIERSSQEEERACISESPIFNLDESQGKAVCRMREGDMVCIAPPGHGKTRIAIEGIKKFLDHSEGRSSGENIVFISFTRAAVREARDRLSECAEANGIMCTTLDSLCGHLGQLIKSRTGIELIAEDYDENIEVIHRALTTGGAATVLLREFITETIDLLVIDEAQDLTGSRLSLAKAIIDHLHDDAKCTILCDPIQAIYSYQEEDESPQPLDQWCQNIGYREFQRVELLENHRVKHAGLALATRKARAVYEDNTIPERTKVMRVLEYASLVGGAETYESPSRPTISRCGFHMFRRNIDALSFYASSTESMKTYGLRLSGRGQMAHPIVAELCHLSGDSKTLTDDQVWANIDTEEIEKRMKIDSFGDLYDNIAKEYGLGGQAHTRLAIDDLASDLRANKLPPFLSQDIIGNKESVCGSIHSFKGRECTSGVLYLDSKLRCSSAEEYRVFYVGMTRPISKLEIIKIQAPHYDYDKFNRRALNKKTLEIEVGLQGDVIWSMNPKDYDRIPFSSYQMWLRKHCCSVIELEAILNGGSGDEARYDIITKQSGRYVGCFSKWMTRKIYFSYKNCGAMPKKFSNIFMLGTESVNQAWFTPSGASEERAYQISLSLSENSPSVVLAPIVLGIGKPKF